MATKFLGGTELYMYECLMQQTPNMGRNEREEKKYKAQYIGVLKQFMREYGYGDICRRVLKSLDKFMFDEFIFCNEEHRDVFWKMYAQWAKNSGRKDNNVMAVIYLLSTQKHFATVLANYVSNPRYVMPKMVENCEGVETYNIYHAVKMISGAESGMTEEDLTEDEIIDDKILCLIINAKFIMQYGINGYKDRKKKSKPQYINNSIKHRRQHKTYNFNGQTIRIK